MNVSELESDLLQKLKVALKQAVLASWNAAIDLHPNEKFYAYILYTSPDIAYLVPSYNSEESLAQMAPNRDRRDYLQWSPDEWEYYRENHTFSSQSISFSNN